MIGRQQYRAYAKLWDGYYNKNNIFDRIKNNLA